MADVDIAPQNMRNVAGAAVTYRSSISTADVYKWPNSGREYILVKKGAGITNMTVVTPRTVEGLAVADRVVALAANTDTIVGPFPTQTYSDGDGDGAVSFGDTALEFAVLRF